MLLILISKSSSNLHFVCCSYAVAPVCGDPRVRGDFSLAALYVNYIRLIFSKSTQSTGTDVLGINPDPTVWLGHVRVALDTYTSVLVR